MSKTVTLRPSGRSFPVGAGQTVLEAALAQGVVLPYGCRTGTCGTCRARLVSGEISYPGPQPLGVTESEAAAGQILLCQARPETDLVLDARELTAAADIRIRTVPCRVERMERLSHDVMGLYLRLPAVERLQFLAGQYVDIILKDGHRRSFSIANPPHDDALLELHVRHVPGGSFSELVFERMKEKALLRLQGPLGSFYLREDSTRPILMMGGGTGFAPLKGMLRHALEHAAISRPVHLYWGARRPQDLYQHALVESWTQRYPNFRYTAVVSHPEAGDRWEGCSGWVHEALLAEHPDIAEHDVYLSGPPPMIEAAHTAFTAAGLPDAYLYYDAFEFAPEVRARLDAEAAATLYGDF